MRRGTVVENSVCRSCTCAFMLSFGHSARRLFRIMHMYEGVDMALLSNERNCYQMSERAGRGLGRAEADLRACSYMLERMQPMRQNTQKRHEAEGRTWLAGGDTS